VRSALLRQPLTLAALRGITLHAPVLLSFLVTSL